MPRRLSGVLHASHKLHKGAPGGGCSKAAARTTLESGASDWLLASQINCANTEAQSKHHGGRGGLQQSLAAPWKTRLAFRERGMLPNPGGHLVSPASRSTGFHQDGTNQRIRTAQSSAHISTYPASMCLPKGWVPRMRVSSGPGSAHPH